MGPAHTLDACQVQNIFKGGRATPVLSPGFLVTLEKLYRLFFFNLG